MTKFLDLFAILAKMAKGNNDSKGDSEKAQDDNELEGQTSTEEVKSKHKVGILEKLNLSCHKPDSKKKCLTACQKTYYVVLSIVTVFSCIAVIAVSVSSAIASKVYNSEQSGRLVAMIVVAFTAAITLAVTIYTTVAAFKRHKKPLHTAAITLVLLTMIQGVIIMVSLRVTQADELNLGQSLAKSFKLALEHDPRHLKLWAMTQYDLTCCGIYGPDDYRTPNLHPYFAPDVPISCCRSFDPDRSELVQERDRQICRARKTYHDVGCDKLVLEVFNETSIMVLGVTISLMALQILLALTAGFTYRRLNRNVRLQRENENEKQEI